MADNPKDKLPGLNNVWAWLKVIGILALLVGLNVVVFLSTLMAGVIVTIPLTAFLTFLLLRDLAPRHRLPPGRPREGVSP